MLLIVNYPLHFSIECQSKMKVMRTYLEATTKLKKNRWANFMKERPKQLQNLRDDTH
ncbi:hypothetical protein BHE74_00044670 [Ensete ventricosum]|nr:hypothetical protein BHE74_00044670 [Ensete ventricosum]